jgi:hypothetical protein
VTHVTVAVEESELDMDRVTFDLWTRRICQATTLDALVAVYEPLCTLPPSHARTDLEQVWQLVWHCVAAGRPLPASLAWAAPEAVTA